MSNPVNLDNPKRIILIEILGKVTGISVLESDQIFSSVFEMKERAMIDRCKPYLLPMASLLSLQSLNK